MTTELRTPTPPAGVLELSIGELESLVLKAVRGAGLPWGLAEEAGRAAGCLAMNALPAGAACARWLAVVDSIGVPSMAPSVHGRRWSADVHALCPIAAGVGLADLEPEPDRHGRVAVFELTTVPLLLAPFAAMLASRWLTPVVLTWAGAKVRISGTGAIQADGEFLAASAEAVQLDCAVAGPDDARGPAVRAMVAISDKAALTRLAERTYVPASEHSRLAGAGAGSDEDE